MRLSFMTLSPALSLRRYAPAPSRREQFSFIVACLHMTIARSAATWQSVLSSFVLIRRNASRLAVRSPLEDSGETSFSK